jgi:hypothetical protein
LKEPRAKIYLEVQSYSGSPPPNVLRISVAR